MCFYSLLLLCTPSFAGQWVVTFTGTGIQNSTGGQTPPCTFTNSQYTAPSNPYYHLVNISGNSCGLGGPAIGTETLNVAATFTWTPSAQGDTSLPPPTLDVLETSSATCSNYWINPTGLITSAFDGITDPNGGPLDPTTTEVPPMYGTGNGGSHQLHFDLSPGQKVVYLPARSLNVSLSCASNQGGGSGGMGLSYAVRQSGPDKSILIGSSIDGTQIYNHLQWLGTGDSRFTNQEIMPVSQTSVIIKGEYFDPPLWTAELLGSTWPASTDLLTSPNLLNPFTHQTSAFTRKWAWNSTSQSDSDFLFDVRTFKTDRPSVDWPWDKLLGYQPHDFLEFCQNGPAPVQKHIWLQLIDTDQYGNHPEWTFNNTANYYVMYHNEAESASNITTSVTPLSENPWKEYIGPNNIILSQVGLAPSTDSSGNPIQGTGTYPWSPGSASVYVEYNWGGSFDIGINGIDVGANGGVNHGTQVSQNVPSTVIPVGLRGTVYWHAPKNRLRFNFRHYSVNGEDVQRDASGNVIPHQGFVDRPVGGLGTTSADFATWLQPDGFNFPPSTTLDLKSAK